jgi:hypothetical protein
MSISTRVIRFIQNELKQLGYHIGKVDGKLGPKTEKGLRQELRKSENKLPEEWKEWPRTRLFTAYVQLRCIQEGVNPGVIDGLWGSQTDYAVNVIRERILNNLPSPNFRDNEELDPHRIHKWPLQTQAEVEVYFGKVGSHLTMLELPYTHRLAWDKTQRIHRYTCHEKVHDSLHSILTRVLEHYGKEGIIELHLDLFGGCYNKRKKKGGSTWSMHAWGVAVDYDPEHNKFRWGWERAAFARPEYDAWWKIWEDEGWTSLGRAKNFDWMHIQAPHF